MSCKVCTRVIATQRLCPTVSKKRVLFTKSSDKEFGICGENTDFYIQVGTSTKKEFQKPDKLAEFAGRIEYQK